MCAIFGIVGKYDETTALRAFSTLSHRGEDESQTLSTSKCFLGVHRLAITAIETPQIQPITKENRHFVMNGEIYNYKALAQELEIDTTSDTEVAFAAYEKWGDAFVEHLRGMFAIAIIEENTLKLFRDPFGKKPLYYTVNEECILFASELKALHTMQPISFRREIIPSYLSFQSPIAPQTFDSKCQQVEAGSKVTFDSDFNPSVSHYFSPLDTPVTLQSSKEAKETIHQKLQESVALRLPSEIPCGALLSGGLDSSLVAAMASKKQTIHTFSIGYDGYESHDERPFAKQVATHIGSIHHAYSFSQTDFLHSINEVLELLDEPLADPAMLPLFYLMKQVRKKGIKVVLTGDGSDELFLGYRTYKEYLDVEQLSSLKHKNWLRNYLGSNFSMHKEWEWYKRILDGTTLFRSTAELFTDLQQNRLLKMNIRDNHSLKALASYKHMFDASPKSAPVDWYTFLDLKIQLGEVFLRKLDRISMAHSIEARTPFLDKELVGSVFACSPELRVEQLPKRWIKEIAEVYLPDAIINRKKKGFNYPYLEWLQKSGELEVIQKIQLKRKLFHSEHLNWILEQGEQGKFQHQIFALYMLCKWMDKKLD